MRTNVRLVRLSWAYVYCIRFVGIECFRFFGKTYFLIKEFNQISFKDIYSIILNYVPAFFRKKTFLRILNEMPII